MPFLSDFNRDFKSLSICFRFKGSSSFSKWLEIALARVNRLYYKRFAETCAPKWRLSELLSEIQFHNFCPFFGWKDSVPSYLNLCSGSSSGPCFLYMPWMLTVFSFLYKFEQLSLLSFTRLMHAFMIHTQQTLSVDWNVDSDVCVCVYVCCFRYLCQMRERGIWSESGLPGDGETLPY